jgi:hypothetical protein
MCQNHVVSPHGRYKCIVNVSRFCWPHDSYRCPCVTISTNRATAARSLHCSASTVAPFASTVASIVPNISLRVQSVVSLPRVGNHWLLNTHPAVASPATFPNSSACHSFSPTRRTSPMQFVHSTQTHLEWYRLQT